MLNSEQTAARIVTFKEGLTQSSAREIVRTQILTGGCATFSDDIYGRLKEKVAAKFGLHTNEVIVVGSSKLGFSIAPKKEYRHFGETSDIDVVMASSHLFDTIWRNVYDYWYQGGYWEHQSDFRKYLFQGWIRPDKLPNETRFVRSQEWWDFFNEITASREFGPYKITGALYKEWHFLEQYQMKSVSLCINAIGAMP